jgi:hypothetical protein
MTPADTLDYVEYELNAMTFVYGDQVRIGNRIIIQLQFPVIPGVGWDGGTDPPFLIPPQAVLAYPRPLPGREAGVQPIVGIRWSDAIEFCECLSSRQCLHLFRSASRS